MHQPNITTIAVTGGPCSGKSTALAWLKPRLEDMGINVVTVPESATHLFSGMGAKIWPNHLQVKGFQEIVTKLQLHQENIALQIASLYREKTLILLDRGLLDSKVYASPEEIQEVFTNCELVEQEMLSRYTGVIHMVTAADGAEEFYTLANNNARTETPQQARELDKKLKQAYVWAPKLQIIDNSSSFEEKLQRTEAAICHILGVPHPIKKENKYLVTVDSWEEIKNISRCVHIEQRYIHTQEAEERLRVRTIDGIGKTYYHTVRRPYGNTQIETSRIISPEEYEHIAFRAKSVVEKQRFCFVYENQYFELDHFLTASSTFDKNRGLLEIKLVEDTQEVELPPFFSQIENVTNNEQYKNQNLALPL